MTVHNATHLYIEQVSDDQVWGWVKGADGMAVSKGVGWGGGEGMSETGRLKGYLHRTTPTLLSSEEMKKEDTGGKMD